MILYQKFEEFKKIPFPFCLNEHVKLIEIANEFLLKDINDIEFAQNLSSFLYQFYGYMNSSKQYGDAHDIFLRILNLSLIIGRVGFDKGKEIIPILKSAIYYEDDFKDYFRKSVLEQELKELEESLPKKKKYLTKKERREQIN